MEQFKMNEADYKQSQRKDEPNTKPLYKVLNEQRTQGNWIGDGCTIGTGINPNDETIADFDPDVEYYPKVSERSKKEMTANIQYTALSVNNLHILSEALIECISLIERMSVMLKVQPTKFSEYNEAKDALSKIS